MHKSVLSLSFFFFFLLRSGLCKVRSLEFFEKTI